MTSERRCPICDSPLPDPAATGRPRKFCGEACRRMAEARLAVERRVLRRLVWTRANLAVTASRWGGTVDEAERAALDIEIGAAQERLRVLFVADEADA